ncbi:hypothetical protein GQ53DRAFT_838560 [Thozetella sp. PMI_491]|nr:hypothetical protein GQ53DRAFT_838560 [Thozetella sp. PMI_491]
MPDKGSFLRFPDASVAPEVIREDVKAIKDAGGGGLEFLPFYNYGQGPPLTDWSKYGFGTPPFKDLLVAALNASAEHGLVFDFALGPNQGQGVPSAPESPGLAYELVFGSKRLDAGKSLNGSLPAAEPHFNYEGLASFINAPLLFGENRLVAVVAAEVLSSSSQTRGRRRTVLRESSVVDLTHRVDGQRLSWTAPADSQGYEVFAFYERYTNTKNCISVSSATTVLGNGSWMVDHFSANGAKKMTGFWDSNLFDDRETRGLLRAAGGYSWKDSLEMMAALWWTPGFLDNFQRNRGYSAVPCLPVLFQAGNSWNGFSPPYNTTFVFDTDAAANGGACNQDYKLTLNEGYQEYLGYLQNWSVSLGVEHSAQPAYNLPLDMMSDVPIVGAPELESLGFSESIDQYRQMAGPAHIAGRTVLSTEIGAKSIGAYALTVPQLVKLFRGSYAGGVNTMVIHGFPYSGDYAGTTWPGYAPFQYRFTDMWGPRMPAWRHLDDVLLYAARNTHVAKVGAPKVDLAFYWSGQSFAGRDIYPGDTIRAAGYTHEYLGFSNIASLATRAANGTLAPDGPAYRALVLYNQAQITAAAAGALLDLAQAGVPIFIVGNAPNVTLGKIGQRDVSTRMGSLLNHPGVHSVPASEFGPEQLASAGVQPRAAVVSAVGGNTSQLYTTWRSDTGRGVDVVFAYNRGPTGTFKLRCETQPGRVPWILDAWTGVQDRLAVFTQQNGTTTVDLQLNQEQTALIAFSDGGQSFNNTTLHASRHSENVAKLQFDPSDRLEALVCNDGKDADVDLANGTTVTIPAQSRAPNITAGPWNLMVESYVPSDEPSSVKGRVQLMGPFQLTSLLPWTQIPGLQNASGIGTYTTTFVVPNDTAPASHAVLLHLGPVRNTMRAWVNGKLAPPVDPASPVADVSPLVAPGRNELRIETSSTLFNAVKARLATLRTAAASPDHPEYYTKPGYADYGLVGPVVLQYLRRVRVA